MKNKHFFRRVISLSAAAAMAASAVISANASASWNMKRIIGDLNGDSAVNIADYLLLSKHVLNVQSLGQDTITLSGHSLTPTVRLKSAMRSI